MSERSGYRSILPKRQTLLFIIAWTSFILLSAFWNIHLVHQDSVDKALIQARTLFELNLAYRKWSSGHGGVYVPVAGQTQPNPYLTVPGRDVTTDNGRTLTLMNPAWITREVFQILNRDTVLPLHAHITSLKYLNPVNKPDAWEEAALHAAEAGQREISEVVSINNEEYMRLLKPFFLEEECLTCHGHQGYKIGNIRGGISMAVPLKPYHAAGAGLVRTTLLFHAFFWLLGIAGLVVYARNTQRQQDSLREEEEKYRLLFENNPTPMWVYDLESLAFLTVNNAAVTRYGYSRGEFLAMTIKDIRPQEDVPRLLENVSRVTSGLDMAGVWRHRRKDGSIISVEITSHTIDFEGRKAEVVLAHDVTEKLRLEEQLRQSQKMEAIGVLAGGIAHDFNNILTAVIGYANLLQMKLGKDDALRAFVDQILSSSERAVGLTQSLLAFSRKQIITPMAVDLCDIIREVEALLARVIGEDIELRIVLPDEKLVVMADVGQIEQVLVNLATNARDSMPDGGALGIEAQKTTLDEAFVARYAHARPGRYVHVSVSDTGTGMGDDVRERIFEPFFTTKEVGKGTGLGLAIVYGIINQHGGLIDVRTTPDGGTTFDLYLPLTGGKAQVREAGDAPAPKGGNETVLVAEDDPEVMGLVRSVLEEFGYRVITATDGADALRQFKAQADAIQLLIFDVVMPKKNGKEVYDEIKRTKRGIKALFMSGYTSSVLERKGISEEGINFIKKPLVPRELLQKVRAALDSWGM